VTVLKNVSLNIPAGKFTALVGASGSGKSTIIQLLERFYDPVEGEITLDGHNIKSLNLRHLRGCMSLVSQEPVLFATTIFGNICHGYHTNFRN
jgi:ATP-binding cassette, subfamily B (MDR/TAP), member 1